MLPAVLVTLITYLLELSNTSPVYNMQPAFITNTLGATTGRNIRNLPCISRRNNNQHGVCMFAIDCLKANGTHLGTCIDRFYFGSCCHIKPVHEIIDNTIESDIIPAREPPLRVTNTTTTSTTTSTTLMISTTTTMGTTMKTSTTLKMSTTPATPSVSTTDKLNLQSSTTPLSNTTEKDVSTTKIELIDSSTTSPVMHENNTEQSISSSIAYGQKLTTRTPPSTESTTIPQKLQTFQVVDGSTLEDISTKPSITTVKPTTKLTTLRPSTQKPTQAKSTTQKPITTKPTAKPTPTSRPTLKPKPTRPPSTTKPTKTPKPLSTKPTQKPQRPTSKPVRTTTKKPVVTTKAPTTAKPTKKVTTTTPKPTKKVTPTSTTTTTKTKPPVTTSTTVKPTTRTTTVTTSKKPEEVTTKSPVVLTTTVSNDIPVNKLNQSQALGTVSGNPVTNEIEASKPVSPTMKPVNKPEIATWTVADNKTHSDSTTEASVNATTEDWVPITTPDGWVLLPSVPSVSPQTTEPPSPALNETTASPKPEESSTTTVASTTSSSVTEGKPAVTYIPLENATQLLVNTTEKPETIPVTTTSPNEESVTVTDPLPDKPVNMSDFTDDAACSPSYFNHLLTGTE